MASPVSRLRQWFAFGAILMIGTVAGMYFYAKWRVSKTVREIPAKIGVEIQQTAEGFSISKSVEGRTLFKVSASKAVQFKAGGRAELHNVKIVIYGKDASRFDRITGDDFEYDPTSGNVTAKGLVLIDLEANPEGIRQSDQTPPAQDRNPIHLESDGLVFNRNTGDASATGKVIFQTPQADGSVVGIQYVAKTGTMTLLSAVTMTVNRPQPAHLDASHGIITKQPRQVVLSAVRMTREQQQMQADQATFFLREDNTVDRIVAEGNVESAIPARAPSHSATHERSERAELWLTGNRNQLSTAVLSGNVQLVSGDAASRVSTGEQRPRSQLAEAAAGRAILHFAAQQRLESVHAEDGVRLTQKNGPGGTLVAASPAKGGDHDRDQDQDIEMTAPVMDFAVKDGRLLERAETSGPPQIVITQPSANQKTVVTAAKFTAKFTGQNRLASLHGEPDAKIVSSTIAAGKSGTPAQSDRVSTSQMLDVVFLPGGGVASITQSGGLTYVDGAEKAWAQRGEYTAADQMLVLSGSPRVVDNGMTTTAQTIRINRATGDALAEGNVKSTYSELKAQPNGGMLASSDPIHVTSRSMMAHRSPAIATYIGDARLWQNANVVEAPTIQFDRDHRSLVAQGATPQDTLQGSAGQPVSTVLVQVDKTGKVTPVNITSSRLNYTDAERKIFMEGGVTAKGADATMTAQHMTVFLLPRSSPRRLVAQEHPGRSSGSSPRTRL